ncbi:MAG TPA: hypothetical protein VFF66_07745 [Brevundimonas sp.]|nr:hypothetical protein [Brevundimonas sp.]
MTQSKQAAAAAADVRTRINPASVVGWGVDADPENDPTWPMRDRSGDYSAGMNWVPPQTQHTDVEVLQSVEHVRRPAVVGQSTPPSGLSGALRRGAFRFSESQWGHWLLLMLADRLNTMEGVLDDFRRGSPPNLLVEMGVVRRERAREAALATASVVVVGLVTLLVLARRRS